MGKLISVDFKANKKPSAIKYKSDTAELGVCAGCQTFGKVHDHICEECKSLFGSKSGAIFLAIRKDPRLAKKCYNVLEKEFAKKRFIEWFGDPNR